MDGADQGSSPLLWANRLWRSFRGVKATLANNDSGCLPRSFWKAFSSGWWPTWKLFDWVFYCRASRWNLTRNKNPTSYHISRHHQHSAVDRGKKSTQQEMTSFYYSHTTTMTTSLNSNPIFDMLGPPSKEFCNRSQHLFLQNIYSKSAGKTRKKNLLLLCWKFCI